MHWRIPRCGRQDGKTWSNEKEWRQLRMLRKGGPGMILGHVKQNKTGGFSLTINLKANRMKKKKSQQNDNHEKDSRDHEDCLHPCKKQQCG